MKKLTIGLIGFFLITGFITAPAFAQWGIGASFEIRNESPKNGFGVRLRGKSSLQYRYSIFRFGDTSARSVKRIV
jgi:hypothetical protein